jgi:hypothetical protein
MKFEPMKQVTLAEAKAELAAEDAKRQAGLDKQKRTIYSTEGGGSPSFIEIVQDKTEGIEIDISEAITDPNTVAGLWMADEAAIEMAKAILEKLVPGVQIVTPEDINRHCDAQD